METDPFASPLISQIIAWVFSVPLILGILGTTVRMLFTKHEGLPRAFMGWLLICLILFSPARYILLQLFVALTYPYQSIPALISSLLLVIYIPVVFGMLFAIGLGIPFYFLTLIINKEPLSKIRLFGAGIAAPVIFIVFSSIYFNVLPYAAYTTHWLHSQEVIRATNGPPYYFYRYVAEPLTPLRYSGFIDYIEIKSMSAKERLRAHAAAVYLNDSQHMYYFYKAYPDYFEEPGALKE